MNRFVLLPLVAALSVLQAEVTYASPLLDSLSVFASGAAVGGTQPDFVTAGNGSVWIEYGNGADSTGAGGSSTIVQYNAANGAIQHQYTISGAWLMDLRSTPPPGWSGHCRTTTQTRRSR